MPNNELRRRVSDLDSTDIIAVARQLIAAASPNPPLDTRAVAEVAATLLRERVPDLELSLHDVGDGIVNLVARVLGNGPGKRLVLNGHLDTYPINPDLPWSVDPLGGEWKEGKLYGRGAADMKGGIAASIVAFAALARERAQWSGELVLALSGDEESMGTRGIQWLLENVPHVRGDAAIIGDAGSPNVVRFGEKGFLWIEVSATGSPAHGAHVHRGVNAIDRLRSALDVLSRLPELPFEAPAAVVQAIEAAKPISEPMSGAGESEVLQRITVNLGVIEGGTSMNLVPASARARLDIRLPAGVATQQVIDHIDQSLGNMSGIDWQILRRIEPSVTDPASPVVRAVARAAADILGEAPAVNMRVGGSDARVWRAQHIPTVVYGPTPFNMGGADEYALADELLVVAQVHALAALDFLGE